MKSVYDQVLNLKYYAGFSIVESWSMPVGLRNYYIEEINKKFVKEQEEIEKARNRSNS